MFRRHTNRFYVALLSAGVMVGVMVGLLLWSTGAFPVRAATSALEGGSYKTADVNEVPPGGTVAYTIVLSNSSGAELSEVVVTDALDPRLSYDSHSYEGTSAAFVPPVHQSGHVTFTLYKLKANSVVTIGLFATLTDTVASGEIITNTATISDPTTVFATNPATFTVSRPPAVQIYDPDSGAVITDQPGDVVEMSGRTWVEFDPAPFPSPPIISPIENFDNDGTYSVNWSDVEGAVNYVLQESDDGTFESPTEYAVSAPGTSQFIFGNSNGTYAYRVAAYDAAVHPSRWSNVRMVTVTAEGLMGMTTQPAYDTALDATVVVSVSTDGGATWHAVDSPVWNDGGWWDWTYDWELGSERKDGVATPLMARAAYAGGGGWSEDTITVTVKNAKFYTYFPIIFKRWPPIPYKITSFTASDPGNDNDYTVSWSYGSHPDAPITKFQLQEDSSSAFDSPDTFELDDAVTSRDFNDRADDTYWYRIRGVNTAWPGGRVLTGPWSDPIEVVVDTGHVYGFNGSTEGWSIKRSDDHIEKPDTLPEPISRNGKLYHLVWGKADFSIVSPMDRAPAVPYTLKARVDVVDYEDIPGDGEEAYSAKTGMTWGIIFGGNGGSPCPADRRSPNGCLNHYYRILITYDQSAGRFDWQFKRIDYHEGNEGGGKGRGVDLVGWESLEFEYDALGWNEWEIRVTDDDSSNIKVYMNGRHLATVTDHKYIDDPYFGTFMASTKELGGVATKWEWFKVQR
jgi:uncharacterized repeat protein (TIGR01451 family)